jgi:hypothetical protein
MIDYDLGAIEIGRIAFERVWVLKLTGLKFSVFVAQGL